MNDDTLNIVMFAIAFVVLPILYFSVIMPWANNVDRNRYLKRLSPEERRRFENLSKEDQKLEMREGMRRFVKEDRDRVNAEYEAKKAQKVHPVKTKILDVNHATKKKGGIAGAVVGSAVAGVPGAIIGAGLAGTKESADSIMFLVFYSDGEKKVETVKKNTNRCDLYLKLLDEENPTA